MSNKKIWKFDLGASACYRQIETPSDFKVLSVAEQGGSIMLWALVDPESPDLVRDFYIYETGEICNVAPVAPFLGTVLLQNQTYALHVFQA